jgi:hypothetical protein
MGEREVFEYGLNTDGNEQILKMYKEDKTVCFLIENQNNQRFFACTTLTELKKVCKGFKSTKTLNDLLNILHSNIEAGNIALTEDEQGSSIDLKFTIKLASGTFPPFSVRLELDNENAANEENRDSLPAKFDYRGNVEAEKKYGKNTKNTTEYNKPEIKQNIKKPIVQLEYIEPTLVVHYPDGSEKKTTLPARIQTVDGQIPDIDEDQFKKIQEEMNKHMANQGGSKYSSQTVEVKKNAEGVLDNDGLLKKKQKGKNSKSKANENGSKSKYSTFSVPAKPIVYPEQTVSKNNAYQNNNIVEYAPNITNQGQYNLSNSYSYNQSNFDFNSLINPSNSYNNYSTNYYGGQSSYQYNNGYYTQNSWDTNQLYSQNLYGSYQYPQSYQYQNNYNTYSQPFTQPFDQAFAEVIPLNPINEYLNKQELPKKEPQNKTEQKVAQKAEPKKEEAKKEVNEEEEEDDEEYEEVEENEEIEDDQEENNEENQEKNAENQEKNAENQEKNEENQENVQNPENQEGGEEEAQVDENDIEALFRTEDGLIIFRNGILKGIIHKYAEIDEVVCRIQDIFLKGAKFILLYKASMHGDKASVFHEKCDNHPNNLVLIETNKGIRFGGFTTQSWEGHCLKKKDNDAFVFSIDKNKLYEVILNELAIGCYPKYGPVFFGCQIRIYDEFFTKGGTTCYRGLNYKTKKDFELNNGEQKFIVKDIEVYAIETIDI